MEQMAQQRKRFMEGNAMYSEPTEEAETTSTPPSATPTQNTSTATPSTSAEESPSAAAAGATKPGVPLIPVQTEYTCCHCLMQAPASEDRPIGLVSLIQVIYKLDYSLNGYSFDLFGPRDQTWGCDNDKRLWSIH